MKHIAFSFILTALLFCSCGANTTKSEILMNQEKAKEMGFMHCEVEK